MNLPVLTAYVTMADDGVYTMTIEDHSAQEIHVSEIPEQYVGMLPMIMANLRNQMSK